MDTIKLPYNFVKLNDNLVLCAEELPNRRYFNPNRNTGMIHCTLKSLSPLYIAGKDGYFFHHGDPQNPVIPGSSLRGMIRSIVQVITWSKLQPVTDKQLYLRDLLNYPDYMNRIKTGRMAGFIRETSSGFSIEPCNAYKVHHHLIVAALKGIDEKLKQEIRQWKDHEQPLTDQQKIEVLNWRKGFKTMSPFLKKKLNRWLNDQLKYNLFAKGGYPNWKFQNKPVWIQYNAKDFATSFQFSQPDNPKSWVQGILVITGYMGNKKHEHVFVAIPGAELLSGENVTTKIQNLEDDDQISDWQKNAFPVEKPNGNPRRKAGAVRDGEPIFYINNSADEIDFLGRASLFRLPYGKSPFELLPESHRDKNHIDMTEAIFGFIDKQHEVDGKLRPYAYKGRVSFLDGKYLGDGSSPYLSDQPFSPRTLASPKPSSYSTYLEQPPRIEAKDTKHAEVEQLRKYSHREAKLRGQKFYWHQVKQIDRQISPLGKEDIKYKDFPQKKNPHEQMIHPIKGDLEFQFKVCFEDLSDLELGALLWALTLPGTENMACAHKLGMGKSIGLGSVKITLDREGLQILDHNTRYTDLHQSGYNSKEPQAFLEKFESYMSDKIGQDFNQHERVKQLRMILSEPGMNWEMVKYADDRGFADYQNKPVLHSVEDVYRLGRIQKTEVASPSLESQPEKDVNHIIGTLVRGVVIDISTSGEITFQKDDSENLGVIKQENLSGRGRNYRVGYKIKAKCIAMEPGVDVPLIFYCTLDFPKDLR
jgi:CRISPR-associated protein (TIGR03986 family)